MQHLWGKVIRIIFMIVSLVAFGTLVFAQNLEVTKSGVVKITTTTGQTGAGFIVRVEPNVVYLITAAHVIAGDNQPKVEFFTKRNVSVKGAVLPGAEVNDDIRGLALVVVRGKDHIPKGLTTLPFQASSVLVSGGEKVFVIGHPGGGGDWAVVKRNISNRVGRDLALDPGMASRFSGGPIIAGDKVVGIVMSNRGEFGLGITHKSVLNYMEGFGVVPSASSGSASTPAFPPFASTQTDGATLIIETTPSGAEVFVDDEFVGQATEEPLMVRDLEPDEYDVRVMKDGFRPWSRSIKVEAGSERRVTVNLQQGRMVSVAGVWANPTEPTISYVLQQQGNQVTMTEVTTSSMGTMVTAQGEGQMQGNQITFMYRTALGTMGQSTAVLSEDGQRLVGAYQDFSNMVPVEISLIRTGDVPADFSP